MSVSTSIFALTPSDFFGDGARTNGVCEERDVCEEMGMCEEGDMCEERHMCEEVDICMGGLHTSR